MFKKIPPLFFVTILVISLIGGVIGAFISQKFLIKENIFQNFYDVENALTLSPTNLKRMIDSKDSGYILVDLRSAPEYSQEHIMTAINIPASSLSKDQLVAEFKKLPKDKRIILYCYSAYCNLAKQVGQVLAHHHINATELNIGWSEWKYHWSLWNPGSDPKDGTMYLEKSSTSSVPSQPKSDSGVCLPNAEGAFGC